MKYLADARLPAQLADLLKDRNFDAIHTDDLPRKAYTGDDEIRAIADGEQRVVVTKDTDFLDSFYSSGSPRKLLIVTTGNIKNSILFKLFLKNIAAIDGLFITGSLIELTNTEIIEHE